MHVDVECSSKFCNGRTVCDVYQLSQLPKNVHVAVKMNVDKFWESMLEAIETSNEKSVLNQK